MLFMLQIIKGSHVSLELTSSDTFSITTQEASAFQWCHCVLMSLTISHPLVQCIPSSTEVTVYPQNHCSHQSQHFCLCLSSSILYSKFLHQLISDKPDLCGISPQTLNPSNEYLIFKLKFPTTENFSLWFMINKFL